MEELLFLHLAKFKHQRDDYVVTELLTEQGIQSILNCNLGTVSRILQKNEEKGLIYRTKLKIENKKRKQAVFFLTKKGQRFALKLNDLLSK